MQNETQQQGQAMKKNHFPWIRLSVLMMVCVLAGGIVGGYLVSLYQENHWEEKMQAMTQSSGFSLTDHMQDRASTKSPAKENAELKAESQGDKHALTPRDIADVASPAVVAINTVGQTQDIFGTVGIAEGAGSGVLISEDGYIVTNNHVISGSNAIKVHLANGKSYDAQIKGQDPLTDLAVIKIEAQNLPYLNVGNSEEVRAGDRVVAIGNPLGELQGTLTVGYISAINRTLSIKEEGGNVVTMYGLLQTDAAINRGNSGGALINMYGELIGINSVKTAAVGVEGLGFAIPTNTVKPIVEDLVKFGHVSNRPTLGLQGLNLQANRYKDFNLPQGVYISNVVPDGPSDKAGLKKGDIITMINDTPVANVGEINGLKTQWKAGETIHLTVYRNGEMMKVDLVLGSEDDLQKNMPR